MSRKAVKLKEKRIHYIGAGLNIREISAINGFCKRTGMKKSEFIREAIASYLLEQDPNIFKD